MENRIRHIESSVLDVNHHTQPLLLRPSFEAVGHLLKIYGGLHRDLDSPVFSRLPSHTVRQHYVNMRLALECCLRWILIDCSPARVRSGAEWEVIDDEVMSLFKWGLEYARLVVAHTAWSRGEMSAKLDEANRTILFSVNQTDPTVLFGQSTFMGFPGEDFSDSLPHEAFEEFFSEWRAGFVHDCPPIIPEIEVTIAHPLVTEMIDVSKQFVMPELPDNEDLGGFTLSDFRRLYAVLFVHCRLLSRLEDYCDAKYGRENYLGSSMFQLPEQEMVEYLVSLSSLPANRIAAIVNLLTFVPDYRGAIVAQPFVRSGCGTITLLARLFCHLEPSGTLPRALLRRQPKVYESLINRIEVENVEQIRQTLAANALDVLTHVQLSGEDGESIEPDLLVYHAQAEVLLVADYKHSLTPVGPAEAVNRTRDHAGHIVQLRKYRKFMERFPSELNRCFNRELVCRRIVSMVLYRAPMPILAAPHPDVIVADWSSLARLISREPVVHLGETIDKYVEVSGRLCERVAWKLKYAETQVGEWIYRHEIFVGS